MQTAMQTKGRVYGSITCLLLCGSWLDESPKQCLEKAIAQTNALDAFRLTLDVENSRDQAGSARIEILYAEPGTGMLRLALDEAVNESWVLEGRVFISDGSGWVTASLPEASPAELALDELFPLAGAIEPGLSLILNLGKAGSRFDFQFGNHPGARAFLLGWLERMRLHAEDLELEGDQLHLAGDGWQYWVSAEDGFLDRLELRSGPDLTIVTRLSLVVGADAVVAEEIPNVGHFSPLRESIELRQAFDRDADPLDLRKRGFSRVLQMISNGQRPWDARARRDWTDFLVQWHSLYIARCTAQRAREERERIDGFASWIAEQLRSDSSAELMSRLRQLAEKRRVAIEESAVAAIKMYQEVLPELDLHGECLDGMREAERATVDRLWEELLVGPLLGYYDQEIMALLSE